MAIKINQQLQMPQNKEEQESTLKFDRTLLWWCAHPIQEEGLSEKQDKQTAFHTFSQRQTRKGWMQYRTHKAWCWCPHCSNNPCLSQNKRYRCHWWRYRFFSPLCLSRWYDHKRTVSSVRVNASHQIEKGVVHKAVEELLGPHICDHLLFVHVILGC